MDNLTHHTSQQQTPVPEWELLLRLLPSGWEQQAMELGAFTRARKVRSPQELLRLVLMHAGVGLSLQRTAEAAAHAQGTSLSKVSIWERVRKTGRWLSWLLAKMLRPRVCSVQIAGYHPMAADASTVTGPKSGVQLRLHYCVNLTNLTCDGLVLSDDRQAESFEHFEVAAGDLLLGDRVYANARGIAHVKHRGGDAIVRLGVTSLRLYDEAGAKIRRLAWLRELRPGQAGECFAQFRDEDGQWIRGRICAVPLSEAQAEKARKRRRKRAQRTGHKLRATTLEEAGYLCLFTTVEEGSLPAEWVLELYRARWQIELAFKRLKSLLGAGQLRDTSPQSAMIWLQAKMVYALLLHAYLDEAGAFSPWGYPLHPTGIGQGAGGSDGHPGVGFDGLGALGDPAGDCGSDAVGSGRMAQCEHGSRGGAVSRRPLLQLEALLSLAQASAPP